MLAVLVTDWRWLCIRRRNASSSLGSQLKNAKTGSTCRKGQRELTRYFLGIHLVRSSAAPDTRSQPTSPTQATSSFLFLRHETRVGRCPPQIQGIAPHATKPIPICRRICECDWLYVGMSLFETLLPKRLGWRPAVHLFRQQVVQEVQHNNTGLDSSRPAFSHSRWRSLFVRILDSRGPGADQDSVCSLDDLSLE